jgi:hypothetical protein
MQPAPDGYGRSSSNVGDLGAAVLLGEGLGELALEQFAFGRVFGELLEGVFEVPPVARELVGV